LEPKNTILEELKDIAPYLVEVGIKTPYSVPKGYFEQLPEVILDKASIGLIPNSATKGFQVPDQYFNGFASKILQRVKEGNSEDGDLFEENESVAPILNTINKGMLFAVPNNYFEQLYIKIPVEKAKVVPMKKMRNWMSYAAAAVFLGIMVTGSFLFSDKKQEQNFEKYQNMDVSSALDKVSDTELNSYIDENHLGNGGNLNENDRTNLDNLEDNIQYISSENLNQYLNENGFLEVNPENSVDK
jgi:hypothetical protein